MAQPLAFLTTLLWDGAQDTAFSKAQKLPVVELPSLWGFWAQALPPVLFAALYNKPSPTQIHIFIILFLEMQFVEGKLGTWCDILMVLDSSFWGPLGSGSKHSSLVMALRIPDTGPAHPDGKPCVLQLQKCLPTQSLAKIHPAIVFILIAVLSYTDCECRKWVWGSVIQCIECPGNFQLSNKLFFLQVTNICSVYFINAFYVRI